jgi:hypothetical protein
MNSPFKAYKGLAFAVMLGTTAIATTLAPTAASAGWISAGSHRESRGLSPGLQGKTTRWSGCGLARNRVKASAARGAVRRRVCFLN